MSRPKWIALVAGAIASSSACANVAGIQEIDQAIDGHGGAFCAGATRPTGTGALFLCDDFDDGALPAPWSSAFQTSGSLAVNDAVAASAPSSLDLVVAPLTAQQPLNVSLRTFTAPPSLPATMSFAFSVDPIRIDPAAGASIVVAAIDFLDAANNRYTVQLAFNVQGGAATTVFDEVYSDGRAYVPHGIATPLGTGSFTDVAITVDWTAAQSATATVTFGGQDVVSTPLTMSVAATKLQLSIGTTYATEPSPGWELRYDNVLFTAD